MTNGVKFNPGYPNIKHSQILLERANQVIPAQTQTLAKGPSQYVKGIAPHYLARGRGSHVWDVDGNEYLDFNMGIGPLSLGYCYPQVDQAIREQLENGITFSLMHPLELEVAELVTETVPQAKSVRFSKTGCDVTSAAVRLARAFTGRTEIISCGYHGWHDWSICTTDRNLGIPLSTLSMSKTFNYNDIDSLVNKISKRTAAVIIEPMLFEYPENNFLHDVRELCNRYDVILIFDEMWTGFRLALGGAQEYFGVSSDLACFSKAVANGMPLSVLTGRADIMSKLEKEVFFFTTFGGEALSLAAAKATIHELRKHNVPLVLEEKGGRLRDGYNRIAQELGMGYTRCIGMGARSLVLFDATIGNVLEIKSLLQQELIRRGILWQGVHSISYSHSDSDIAYALEAYREALPVLKKSISSGNISSLLLGEPMQPTLRTVTGRK